MSRYLTLNYNQSIKVFTIETNNGNLVFHTLDETENKRREWNSIPSITFTINDITLENIIVNMNVPDYEYTRISNTRWYFGLYNNPITDIPQYLWFNLSQLRVP